MIRQVDGLLKFLSKGFQGTLDELSRLYFAETLVGLTEMLTLLLLTPAHMHFLYTILSSAPQRRKTSHVF